MLRHLRVRELREKLRIFETILAEEKDPAGIADAQERIKLIKAELKKFELPDDCFQTRILP